jgi:hypothetical protein
MRLMTDNEMRRVAEALRLDSNETAVFMTQLRHVQSTVLNVLYPELRGRFYVPLNPDQAPEGTTQIGYRQWDAFGMARVISHWAQDLPRVGIAGKEFFIPVKTIGNSYGYTIADVKAAALTGKPLSADLATVAREIMERTIDQIILFGMAEAGTSGLFNNPNVPIVSLPTGTWSGATAANILKDLLYFEQQIFLNNKGTMTPDTLLVDPASWGYLQTPIGNELQTTILATFLKNSQYVKNVEQHFKLSTAGADAGPRLMCYKRDLRAFDLQIPVSFSELPPEVRGLAFSIACYAQIAGVMCKYPLGAAYADNAG